MRLLSELRHAQCSDLNNCRSSDPCGLGGRGTRIPAARHLLISLCTVSPFEQVKYPQDPGVFRVCEQAVEGRRSARADRICARGRSIASIAPRTETVRPQTRDVGEKAAFAGRFPQRVTARSGLPKIATTSPESPRRIRGRSGPGTSERPELGGISKVPGQASARLSPLNQRLIRRPFPEQRVVDLQPFQCFT